ncbi:hypothetical protein BC937DRAFT_89292 [Endogone sp. FLAS-F59071]|nr:hypothetical protein BC937DRAFT_89292 [Endogone sp. FLAS-F59071]|eukprot:RUS17976.1 hypothetical protein BC937DRAFT_89292 [Endogone sp. FLAS-F59071]
MFELNSGKTTVIEQTANRAKEDPIDKLNHAMKYKAKYNKPAVLILDDISKLIQSHSEVIDNLQQHYTNIDKFFEVSE